jgi:hypothetical protein
MLSPTYLLVLLAFGLTLVSAVTGRLPLWVAVLLLSIALLIR